MHFSIISDNWIPVLYKDGSEATISLRTAFLTAESIKDISEESCMEKLGIIRLLCVFFMDIYRPERKKDRLEYLDTSFNMDLFDSYVSKCEKKGTSFNLFDNTNPFMQTGILKPEKGKPIKYSPVSRINDFDCSGDELVFFGGKNEIDYTYTPAKCMRLLCQKTCTVIKNKAGQGYKSFAPLQNAIFMLRIGNCLKETIVYNSTSKKEWENFNPSIKYGTEDGCNGPTWKQGILKDEGQKYCPMELSLLQLMTYVPIYIKFIPNKDGTVNECYYTGRNFKRSDKETENEKEPFLLYKDPMIIINKSMNKDGLLSERPERFNPDSGFWETLEAVSISNVDITENSTKHVSKPLVITGLDSSESYRVEVWTTCQDGNGKGVVYNESVEISDAVFGAEAETVQGEVLSISKIINGLRKDKKISSNFTPSSNKLFSLCLTQIIKDQKSYMSGDFMKNYIPRVNELIKTDYRAVVAYKKEYFEKTVEMLKEIALSRLDKINGNYDILTKKMECKKALHSYYKNILEGDRCDLKRKD